MSLKKAKMPARGGRRIANKPNLSVSPEPVQILARLLVERGIDPSIQGIDIAFLHTSYCPEGHTFKGQAQADAEIASVEFWLSYYPRKDDGEAELQAKIRTANENPAMLDEGTRWMRFFFTKNHLAFVAQLNKRETPFDEDTARSRLESLMTLMEAELPGLLA